jgi:hypothetical protein
VLADMADKIYKYFGLKMGIGFGHSILPVIAHRKRQSKLCLDFSEKISIFLFFNDS